ncbi:transcription factor 23 [Accipiter gentilis]|uniref:transcription factor 23 n=1 Tax=Astur gentilis TaxID=8957 RepID=UPI002110D4B5|nr:transcription factor 23 [Accipiter gentilis]
MAESVGAGDGGGCGAGPAATYSCSPATTAYGSRGRRGTCSPARAARRCRGAGAGRTPGPSSADSGSPPAAGQGPPGLPCPQNAARERSRVRALRQAFLSLQAALPAVPPGTKLSKLDILVLATSYIAHLSHALGRGPPPPTPSCPLHGHPLLHPLKKWPMRSRLYVGPWGGPGPDPPGAPTATSSHEHTGLGDSRLETGDGPP